MKFLDKVANKLFEKHGAEISDYTIIFPNIRTSLFFQSYLSQYINKPIWAPRYSTIKDEFINISGLDIVDDTILISELYNVYISVLQIEETFDEFYYWGQILLSDFDEIDKYLVSPDVLFANVSEINNLTSTIDYLSQEQKDIINQFWNTYKFSKESREKNNFKKIWSYLHQVYLRFNEELFKKNIAYEGMMYKKVANMIDNDQAYFNNYNNLYFIGFNALNNCEINFLKYLKVNKKARFIWDYDTYYLNNNRYEAGYFIRENIKLLGQDIILNDDEIYSNFEKQKNITYISVSNKFSETKTVGDIILNASIKDQLFNNFDNTVIVLADESLLIPLVYSIPDNISGYNITMGYPISSTFAFSLINEIIDASTFYEYQSFNANNIFKLLNNKLIKVLFDESEIKILNSYILDNNLTNISFENLKKYSFFSDLINVYANSKEASNLLINIFSKIIIKSNTESVIDIEKEACLSIINVLKKYQEIIKSISINLNLVMYFRILKNLISNLKIPFEGEPLSGMQVMGMLETRLLDFDNVIVLSMNEGVVSGNINPTSFIPYNLRKGFSLPTIEQYEAIYAYYFYRLIQRAKNLYFIYNTDINDLKAGEMSRFMNQIKYESKHKINESVLLLEPSGNKNINIKIKNNTLINSQVEAYKNGQIISPTAIYTFIECRFKFYLKYILRIAEPIILQDKVDGLIFGKLIHDTMYKLYSTFINKEVLKKDLENIILNKPLIYSVLNENFEKNKLTENGKLKGENILIFDVIYSYIIGILKRDIEKAPYIILSLEQKYDSVIELDSCNINIGGFIDRLDSINNSLQIIDYKTGKDKNAINEILDLFSDTKDDLKGYFQTMIYTLILKSSFSDLIISPSLYSVKQVYSGKFDSNLYIGSRNNKQLINSESQYFSEFKQLLKLTLKEILSKDCDYTQTENEKKCNYCTYNEICRKN